MILLVCPFVFIHIFVFIFFFYIACCDSCGFGCDGGFPQAAWAYFKTTGLVTGGNYNTKQGCEPYTIKACDHQYVFLMNFLFFSFTFLRFSVSMEVYHQ
jgi:hypothetical protein